MADTMKGISPGNDPRRHTAYDAATIAEARRLRNQGWTYDAISNRLGPSLAVLNKWLADIPKPKTQKQAAKSLSAYDREQRRQTMADHAIPMHHTVDDADTPTQSRYLPEELPDTPVGFTLDGIFPDHDLVVWAGQIQERWSDDRARGRIFDGVPIEVIKAQIITSTILRPWDRAWMADNREMWAAIRKFTTLNVDTLAKRIGISASSLTRYSNATRTPTKGDFDRICVAMWTAMQERLWTLDWWLCLDDYVAAHDLGHEDRYRMEDAMRWISGIGDTEEGDPAWDGELTLDHLPSLTHLRSLMSAPLYRDEDTILFGYLGYGGTLAETETGAA